MAALRHFIAAVRQIVALVGMFALSTALVARTDGESGVAVYLFWAQGCPHCEREIGFLDRMRAAEPRLRLHTYEVSRTPGNRVLFIAFAGKLGLEELSVPLTVIGDQVTLGYDDDVSTGAQLRWRIDECLSAGCPDETGPLLAALAGSTPSASDAAPQIARAQPPPAIKVPYLGEIGIASLSLPMLTLALGALDGFNPCAMWVLVFLIGLLLGMRDRLRMWLLGSVFIAASAAVYFLFMAAWLNFLLFVGLIVWVRVGVATVALGGGIYYLREYFVNPEAMCKVTAPERRRHILERLKQTALQRSFLWAVLGIIALAFAVNLVELFCSAGIPAVYTQVLAMNALPRWQYYTYVLLYIVVFMLDDLIVFGVAMTTLQLAGMTTRYVHLAHGIGGVVLLAIGALMLIRPQWLMFG